MTTEECYGCIYHINNSELMRNHRIDPDTWPTDVAWKNCRLGTPAYESCQCRKWRDDPKKCPHLNKLCGKQPCYKLNWTNTKWTTIPHILYKQTEQQV